MLVKFAVTNYRGFAERIEWDLSHPNNYGFNTFVIKNGIIKNGIIYGPNGSGKTNFGLALFDMENHLSQKWKKPDYYDNFVYMGKPNQPVKFDYTFKFESKIVEYSYSKDQNGVLLTEFLIVDRKHVFSKMKNSFEIDETLFPMDKMVKNDLAYNANNISVVNFILTSYPLAENHYLMQLQKFANSMLWFRCLDTREFIGVETNNYNLNEYIIKNNLIEDFSGFLEKVSEQKFKFVTFNHNDKTLFCRIKDYTIPFDQIASTGTRSLMLLYFWIKKMNQTSFVFIDEFDAFYHFKLSYEVCRQLFTLDAQVFTSSHNTYLMTNDLLRPDCNFIVNHNRIKPLCECTDKELRFGHNIEKLFRGNTFQV